MFLMDESHLGAAFLFALSSVATSFLNAFLFVMSMLLIMRSFGPEKSSQHAFYGGAISLSSVKRITSTFAVARCLCGYLNLLIIS